MNFLLSISLPANHHPKRCLHGGCSAEAVCRSGLRRAGGWLQRCGGNFRSRVTRYWPDCLQKVYFLPCGNHIIIGKYTSSRKLSQSPLTLVWWSNLKYLFSLAHDECSTAGFAWEVSHWGSHGVWGVGIYSLAESSRRHLNFYSCLQYCLTPRLCTCIFR